jgi:recombination DNA repair RAD52 pathway protein
MIKKKKKVILKKPSKITKKVVPKIKKRKVSTTRAIIVQQLDINSYQKGIITAKTPEEFIKEKTGRGYKKMRYVEGGYVISKLNEAFSPAGWDFEIEKDIIEPTEVAVKGKLTIKDHKGHSVVKTQFGQATRYKGVPLGDTLKSASTDSLKKCASLLGIALDVYWNQLDDQGDKSHIEAKVREDVYSETLKMIKAQTNGQVLAQWRNKINESKIYTKEQQKKLIEEIDEQVKKS